MPRELYGGGGATGKGGSGTGISAKEDPDSLRSRQYALIKEILSEGPIVGLVPPDRPMRGILLDGTPVENVGGRVITDATIVNGSTTITSNQANWTQADVGKIVTGEGIQEMPAAQHNTSIASVTDASHAVMNQPAKVLGGGTLTNVTVSIAGALNFTNFQFWLMPGVQDQGYLPNFDASSSVIPVGVQLKNSVGAWIQTITETDLDAMIITIRFPRLQQQDKKTGDIHGTSVNLTIDVQSNGGGFVNVINDTVKGKASSPYLREYKIELAGLQPPWDFRVTRVTADSNSEALANDTYIDSYQTVIYGKLRHPNTAIAGFLIDAEQFGSIPTRGYHIQGLIVKVPTNYDPVARAYATTGPGTTNGTWDGTFKLAYTNNPAWCWYDLATNTRYGLGNYLDINSVDKWSLYTIAQFCDVFVSTGFLIRAAINTGSQTFSADGPTNSYQRASGSFLTDGFQAGDEIVASGFANAGNNGRSVVYSVSATVMVVQQRTLATDTAASGRAIVTQAPTEPRFTCNLVLQKGEDAMKVLSDMAAGFRAMLFYAQGTLTPVQDVPGVASTYALFTPANVVDGRFTYTGTGKRARHTVVNVMWNDLTDQGKAKPEYVEDVNAIIQLGINAMNVTAFGCTSRGQARRFGLWMLAAERLLTETVTFEAGQAGFLVRPGSIVQIQDPFKQGMNIWSGRLAGASTSTLLTLDRSVTLVGGRTYFVSFVNPADGTSITVTVLNSAGTTSTLTIAALTAYSSGTNYGLGAQVTSAGINYQSIAPNNQNHTPASNPTWWSVMSPAEGTVWQLSSDILSPLLYRVVEMKPKDLAMCTITALKYDPNVYTNIENIQLQALPTGVLTQPNAVLPPGAITLSTVTSIINGIARTWMEVSWVPSTDPNLSSYQVSYRFNNGNWTQLPNALTALTAFEITTMGPGTYDVRVYAQNKVAALSQPALATLVVPVTNPLALAGVTGLELSGQGNNTVWLTADASFDWRYNSPSQAGANDVGTDTTGIGSLVGDPHVQNFDVSIFNPVDGQLIWHEVTTLPHYVFTRQKNVLAVQDTYGTSVPLNTFTISVCAIDLFNNKSTPASLTVTNPAPAAPVLTVTPGATFVDILAQNPGLADFGGMRVWRSFDPAHVVSDADVPVYDGQNVHAIIQQQQGVTAYYWVAIYDHFNTLVAQLNLSPKITVITPMTVPTDAPPTVSPGSQSFSLTTVSNCTTNSASAIVTSSAGFTSALVGAGVQGTGIPPNTYVLSYTNSSTITLSQQATASGTTDLTFGLSIMVSSVKGTQTAQYTVDGTPPQSTSFEWPLLAGVYTQLSIFAQTILQVRGVDPVTLLPTKTMQAIYTLVSSSAPGQGTTATPTLSYTGTLGGTAHIVLTCLTSGAIISYSVNGAAAVTYSGTFDLNKNDSIEYWATSSGNADSAHATWSNISAGGGGSGDPPTGRHPPQ